MNRRNTYTLSQVREYDPRNQFQRDFVWRSELVRYSIFSLVILKSACRAGFGKGTSLLVLALGACFLWNLLGRKDGWARSLFLYFSALTFLGWLGIADLVVMALALGGPVYFVYWVFSGEKYQT